MRIKNFVRILTAGILTFLSLTNLAVAQVAAPIKTLDERLTEIEQEVQVLKRLKEVEQEVNLKKEKENPIVKAGKDGFAFSSKDGDFTIKFKGVVQADSRFFAGDDRTPGVNTFVARRVRPIFEGTVFRYVDYRVMPDFGNGSTTLQDAYIDFKYWKSVALRAGKFKSPFGLEQLQSDSNTAFIERGLPTTLVPNRDTGIDLYGELFDGVLRYDAGVFNGAVDAGSNDTDNADDKDFVGRIFAHPFKNVNVDALNGLGIGVATSFGEAHGSASSPQLPSFRTIGQLTDFSYRTNSPATAAGTAIADGDRIRVSPQFYYYYGPFGILGEYVRSAQEVRVLNSSGEVVNEAWQIAGSYVITGENASYNGVNPRNPFDLKNGKWGAFELVGRFHQLSLDEGSFPQFAAAASSVNSAKGYTLGLNWYLNKNLMFKLNYDQLFFDGGDRILDRETENLISTRLQLAF